MSLIALVLSLAFFWGCTERSWQSTKNKDTVLAYYAFYKDNTESEHAAEAKARLISKLNAMFESVQEFEPAPEDKIGVEFIEELNAYAINNLVTRNLPTDGEEPRELLGKNPQKLMQLAARKGVNEKTHSVNKAKAKLWNGEVRLFLLLTPFDKATSDHDGPAPLDAVIREKWVY
jgi:hypothetical protein